MSPRALPRMLWVALAALASVLSLHSGMLAALPSGLRIALAFGVLVLLPGEGWRRAIGAPLPGGAWFAAGPALALGVAWAALAVLATHLVGVPFTVLVDHGALWTLVPWMVASRTAPRTIEPFPALPRLAIAAVVAAMGLAALHAFQLGTPVSYFTDSPDHIATVRRMLASGQAFPVDAFFRDPYATFADPRKGLWHPVVALVCALAQADPFVVWRALPALLAPLFVLQAASFAWWLGGPLGAAAGAWGLLLTYGGGLGMQYLREAVFSTKLADQLALGAAAVLLTDLERRTTRTRIAVMAAMLGTVLAHVFGAIQFALAFGGLGLGLVLRDRGLSAAARRVAVSALAGAAVALPYLLWRAGQAYAPNNVIHTEPQGLLELAPGAVIVSYGVLWDWLGPLWVLFPASLIAWWRAAVRPAALYLATTTSVVFLLLFVPPVVAVLEPRLGYLLMRFPWLLPASAATAYAVVALRDAWRQGRRVVAVAWGVLLVIALGGPVGDAARTLTRPSEARAADATVSVERWGDALAWMDANLPHGTVVLSDPATSYSVPMMTRHWVTALLDQHSSPNDSLALDRILDARDALDPFAGWGRTAEVVERWGATVIVLNGRWDAAPDLDYWAPDADWYEAARARLASAPSAFRAVWEQDRFSIWTIDPVALASLPRDLPVRPFRRPLTPDDRGIPIGDGVAELVGVDLAPDAAVHGDTLRGVLEWHARAALPAGSYRVAVRFDRPLPEAVPSAPAAVSKLWRKAVERLHGERYRFRSDHLPVDGAYGVDRWRSDEVVRDSFRVVIPADVATGEYTVKVAMIRQPHYPNLRLRDLTSDDDLLDGWPVDTVRVSAAGGR